MENRGGGDIVSMIETSEIMLMEEKSSMIDRSSRQKQPNS